MQNYHKEFIKKMAQIPGEFAIVKPRCNIDELINEARIVLNTALGIPENLYSLKGNHSFNSERVEQIKRELKKEFENQNMQNLTANMIIDESGIKDINAQEGKCKQ